MEIAVRVYNGINVITTYETLIQPNQRIRPFITSMTGSDDEMMKDSPCFNDIGEEVFRLHDGRIFVDHNANFDYSFVPPVGIALKSLPSLDNACRRYYI